MKQYVLSHIYLLMDRKNIALSTYIFVYLVDTELDMFTDNIVTYRSEVRNVCGTNNK